MPAQQSPPPRHHHPFLSARSMGPAPLPVVSSRDADVEDECPVCLEPLSFSFRLPGEKPHITPECGHSLHEACFSAVYGPPPGTQKHVVRTRSNLGVCGVCRRPMKVGDGDGSKKSNKLASLTGMGQRTNGNHLYPGRDQTATPRQDTPRDPNEDDPLDHAGSVRSGGSADPNSQYIVAPSIQVRPEFSSITRTNDPTQPLTCIVVLELPSRRPSGHVPGPVLNTYNRRTTSSTGQDEGSDSTDSNGRPHPAPYRPGSPTEDSVASVPYAYNQTPAAPSSNSDPFHFITEDLRSRIMDWKGHPLSGLGPLQMYDLLSVRRDALVREFFVYLFKEAIICVIEEKRRGLSRFIPSGGQGPHGESNTPKGVLRLKGRIYIRHIRQVTDTSVAGELSLTIDMEDERLESFILIFKDRSSLETWRAKVTALVVSFQTPGSRAPPAQTVGIDEFGGSSKAARMLSGSTMTTMTHSDLASHRSTISSATSYGSLRHPHGIQKPSLNTLDEDHESGPSLISPHLSAGPSNALAPLSHPPLDLILILSAPPPHAAPSTAQLKIRVLKTSLDFVTASLGPRDRLALVAFEVGHGGRVRKTPFFSLSRAGSRARLNKFVEGIGSAEDDDFVVRGNRDEKTDVVTAVNHGLDVVLQRKTRNPVTGMLLVSDAADSTRRAQMDLVLARAEAANVPIHSFGYGRSHDPAALWLISNHTSGTYTFVKDWYDLRDCLAGCIGGMMSIGLLSMKLHMKIVDGHRFRIRKVSGGPNAIVASDGRDVDIDFGELRYGERKEMLVELELDNSDIMSGAVPTNASNGHLDVPGGRRGGNSATDAFVQRMGLDMSMADMSDLVDGMMDHMIDEVPVFEVDGAFFDPAAGKHVSRLAHPVLLTVTLLPPGSSRPSTASGGSQSPSDPVIVRRRMELFASDMITRALVLVSRKNVPQAAKILAETKRILHTVLQSLPPPMSLNGNHASSRNRKETLTLAAVRALQSILSDMQVLAEALEESMETFQHDQRNFGAQQAMILRDQRSWSGRTPTEKLFWTSDNSIELVSRSTDWVARET